MASVGTIGSWLGDWGWGLLLVTVTLVIHAMGITVLGALLVGWFGGSDGDKQAHVSLFRFPSAIAVVSLALAVLHGFEAGVWAATYLWLGATDTFRDGIVVSLQMATTLGPSSVDLRSGWRLMGPLEGVAGMLSFGLSTAFLIAVFQRVSPFGPPDADQRR